MAQESPAKDFLNGIFLPEGMSNAQAMAALMAIPGGVPGLTETFSPIINQHPAASSLFLSRKGTRSSFAKAHERSTCFRCISYLSYGRRT